MPKKPMHPPSESTATFIRERLLEVKKDYPYSMWKLWKEHLLARNMKPPLYESFRKYVYTLKRAGLIRKASAPTKRRVAHGGLKPTEPSYYELVANQIGNTEAWQNPQVAVWGEKMRFGARKYARKVLGLPPKKRGRKKKDTYQEPADLYKIPS